MMYRVITIGKWNKWHVDDVDGKHPVPDDSLRNT
jgi:hypothetical protein